MMTPIHTDLMKYSTPAAPTEHERQAFRSRRHARRVAFSTFSEKVLLRMTRFAVVVKQPRVISAPRCLQDRQA